MNTLTNQNEIAEYVIIGAGPAALCAIPNILNMEITKDKIIWIDPAFKVGAFGTTLSKGSSVPGNTMVKSYRRVYSEIYQLMPSLKPSETHLFELDQLSPNFVGSLKIAAKPMQFITNGLRNIIPSVEGLVTNIVTTELGLKLEVKLANHNTIFITTKRAILATGSQAKTCALPHTYQNIKMIDANTVFIQSELTNYLQSYPNIKIVAVIGSSHSAALATMHLLKAGLAVKQFMNKEYKYATPVISANGTEYILHDNTGLKGDVAHFTKQLLKDINEGTGPYCGKLTRFIGKDRAEVTTLLEQNLSDCTHAVVTIGYTPSQTLLINDLPISALKHNSITTAFEQIPGLFGIGIAFPQTVKSIDGEDEAAVGVEKFWNTTSNVMVQNVWQKCSYHTKTHTALS